MRKKPPTQAPVKGTIKAIALEEKARRDLRLAELRTELATVTEQLAALRLAAEKDRALFSEIGATARRDVDSAITLAVRLSAYIGDLTDRLLSLRALLAAQPALGTAPFEEVSLLKIVPLKRRKPRETE
jgi:hypothetical protein